MNLTFRVSDFEGPLDLLLFLIRENEIDIYDIPIAEITRQYMETLEMMQQLDLEIAGEYILMAATLIQIKARMLLPQEELEDGEIEDPRRELVSRLVEFQEMRNAARELQRREHIQRNHFYSGYRDLSHVDPEIHDFSLKNIDIMDIARAWFRVMRKDDLKHYHEVGRIPVTVEDQIRVIRSALASQPVVALDDLVRETPGRIHVVVTFLAVLEMVRNQQVVVRQVRFGDRIWIFHPDHFLLWQDIYFRDNWQDKIA